MKQSTDWRIGVVASRSARRRWRLLAGPQRGRPHDELLARARPWPAPARRLATPRSRKRNFSTTAIRWACLTPRRSRKKTRWAWTTSPCLQAAMRTSRLRPDRSGSAPRRSRSSAFAPRPPAPARWTGRCVPQAGSSPTSAGSMPSRRSSRVMSSACWSTSRASR